MSDLLAVVSFIAFSAFCTAILMLFAESTRRKGKWVFGISFAVMMLLSMQSRTLVDKDAQALGFANYKEQEAHEKAVKLGFDSVEDMDAIKKAEADKVAAEKAKGERDRIAAQVEVKREREKAARESAARLEKLSNALEAGRAKACKEDNRCFDIKPNSSKAVAGNIPIEDLELVTAGSYEKTQALIKMAPLFVNVVRSWGGRCDSISSLTPYLFKEGVRIKCNQFRYKYHVENKNGIWTAYPY